MTQPINIPSNHPRRDRSSSHSSSLSSLSSSSPPLHTPRDSSPLSPKVSVSSTSPILSYFFPQNTSPINNKKPIPPIPSASAIVDHDSDVPLNNTSNHARRLSTSWLSSHAPPSPVVDSRQERADGLLRRLSLSSAFSRPTTRPGISFPAAPAPSPITPNSSHTSAFPPSLPSSNFSALPADSDINQVRKTKRSATVNLGSGGSPNARSRRAPSPMGERILKGHFDGFN